MTENNILPGPGSQDPDAVWTREEVRVRIQKLAHNTADEKVKLRCLEMLFDVAPAPAKSSPMGSAFRDVLDGGSALPHSPTDVTTSQSSSSMSKPIPSS